jgi:hypothetical protein
VGRRAAYRNSDNNYGSWNKKGQATEIELSADMINCSIDAPLNQARIAIRFPPMNRSIMRIGIAQFQVGLNIHENTAKVIEILDTVQANDWIAFPEGGVDRLCAAKKGLSFRCKS